MFSHKIIKCIRFFRRGIDLSFETLHAVLPIIVITFERAKLSELSDKTF